MDQRCAKHQFEPADGVCRDCGGLYCNECLVYSFGPRKPPFCVSCALAASGVRANGSRAPKTSRKEMKRRMKLHDELRRSRESATAQVDTMAIDFSSSHVGWASAPSGEAGPTEMPIDRHIAS